MLELFQWNSSEETVRSKRNEIEEELADIMIYSKMLASNLNLNIEEIILNKLKKTMKNTQWKKAKETKKNIQI